MVKRIKKESSTIIGALGAIAMNDQQQVYLDSIKNNIITIVNGPAGTGKTFMPTLYGINEFLKGKYKKIIFSRPCVESGKSIG